VTKRCNARCSFCFYISEYSSEEESEELSLEEFERLSTSMGSLLWLAFSGGEIFLRNDIAEITKIFYDRNRPAIILLPTNGLLTEIIREKTEEILRYCKKSTVVVKLSLDGPETLHDSLRGVKGCFKKTLQTYHVLSELLQRYPNFELGINTVFCSLNEDYMDEIIEFVNGLNNIRTHTISLIRGEVADESLKEVDLKKYLKTIKKLETNLKGGMSPVYRFKGARLKASQDIIQRRLIYETATQKRALLPCYAGRINLVITDTGEVYPCETFSPSLLMGNIRASDYDIQRILESGRAKEVVRLIRNGCYCTHECYLMTNILFNPSTYPLLMREYVRLLVGSYLAKTTS
jgi:radical SAM protein with 4Fe4S-binding SPASM domain